MNEGDDRVSPTARVPGPTSTELAQERTALAGQRTTLAYDRDRLALIRTELAYERTLMAWVRTSASLISFGFTIYKFFDELRRAEVTRLSQGLLGSRGVALVMIALGVVALTVAVFEHRRALRALRDEFGEYGVVPRSLAGVLAAFVAGFGVLGLTLVLLRQ